MHQNLESIVANYHVVQSICSKALALTLQNDRYISDFKLPNFWEKSSKDKVGKIQQYFDHLNDSILENFYLELFACFEATVLEKVKLASGEMSKILKKNYKGAFPFVSYEDRFVKNIDDMSGLNKILDLLKDKIPSDLFKGLEEIVKYRNKLAHGKRFHENINLNSLEDTHKIMREIIAAI